MGLSNLVHFCVNHECSLRQSHGQIAFVASSIHLNCCDVFWCLQREVFLVTHSMSTTCNLSNNSLLTSKSWVGHSCRYQEVEILSMMMRMSLQKLILLKQVCRYMDCTQEISFISFINSKGDYQWRYTFLELRFNSNCCVIGAMLLPLAEHSEYIARHELVLGFCVSFLWHVWKLS